MILRQVDSNNLCGLYQPTEFIRHEMTFYNSGTIKSIDRYISETDKWLRSGYQYEFYSNGRISQILFHSNGQQSQFSLKMSQTGKFVQLLSYDGHDMLSMIDRNVSHESKSSDIDTSWVTGRGANGNYVITFKLANGEIINVEERNMTQINRDTYSTYRDGIYIAFNSGHLVAIWNYKLSERIGESLIFNRGKLRMFMYKGLDTVAVGYKVKDLKHVTSATPCSK